MGALLLLARRSNAFFAIGATCTHYGGPLADGLMVDETVRCPWHHACFSLKTGEALHAPALSPVACWSTELVDDKVFVRGKVGSGTGCACCTELRVVTADRDHRWRWQPVSPPRRCCVVSISRAAWSC